MLLGTQLAGCGMLSLGGGSQPFDVSVPMTRESVRADTHGDVCETLLAANPYYMGAVPPSLPGAKAYLDGRAGKVAHMIETADAVIKSSDAAADKLATVRGYLLTALAKIHKADPRANNSMRGAVALAAQTGETALIAGMQAKSSDSAESTNALAASMASYRHTVDALDYGGAVLADADRLAALAASTLVAVGQKGTAADKQIAAQLDRDMGSLDAASGDMATISAGRVTGIGISSGASFKPSHCAALKT